MSRRHCYLSGQLDSFQGSENCSLLPPSVPPQFECDQLIRVKNYVVLRVHLFTLSQMFSLLCMDSVCIYFHTFGFVLQHSVSFLSEYCVYVYYWI